MHSKKSPFPNFHSASGMIQRKSPPSLMSRDHNKPLSAAAESTVHDGLDSKDEPGDFIETNCHWVSASLDLTTSLLFSCFLFVILEVSESETVFHAFCAEFSVNLWRKVM